MTRLWRSLIPLACLLSLLVPSVSYASPRTGEVTDAVVQAPRPIAGGIQSFLERKGSVLAGARFGERSAAEIIEGYTSYYSLDPRLVLTLLELVSGLITSPQVDEATLRRPFGPAGPEGFERQIEWAVREVRASFGPFESEPVVIFADGGRRTLSLDQPPEVIAIGLFLGQGRTEKEWQGLMDRFSPVYDELFGDEPPPVETPPAARPFLSDPWPAGTRVIHTSFFDHAYPMVDVDGDGNAIMVDYFGRGGLSYNGHDGHDFYFPDLPYGTPILAAAPGWAYARTTRGNGVVIRHIGDAEGYETVYWHLADFAPIFAGLIDSDEPVWVERGAFLGWSGDSGFTNGAPHLHFEVRHNGRQVDPFGWYGPGEDPCLQYYACEVSVWLWDSSSIWQRPDELAAEDRVPPFGLLAVNPDADLLLAAHFDGTPLPHVGAGMVYAQGVSFEPGRFSEAVRVAAQSILSFPVSSNLELEEGTLAFWALVPERFPSTSTGRNYLIAASDHPADPARIYSGTFALRYEAARDQRPALWSFWTVSDEGQPHNLAVPDTLKPGWHHFTLSWLRRNGEKKLYIDGQLVAVARGVELPGQLAGRLELGRWHLEAGVSGALFDDLAIWRRALPEAHIVKLAQADGPLPSSATVLYDRSLYLVTQAIDDGGGIVQVQLGIDGRFSVPMAYFNAYRWQLPAEEGIHEVAVRYVDRAGNTTTVTRSVELRSPPQARARLIESGPLTATVALSASDEVEPLEVLLSSRRDGSDGSWEPFTPIRQWRWRPGAERVLYVRFRNAHGAESALLLLNADGTRIYLPYTTR
ncbi:MAG: peptidase M23 [Herpetosiphonaceae bacterium]|nr:MAG: peptidase M23 [Herpetosiphonaceae bacterium]